MDKLKIWLIPGIVVILAIGGLIYFRGKLPQQTVTEKPTVTQEEAPPTKPKGFAKPEEPLPQVKAQQDNEAMLGALHSGDMSDCDKITWSDELKKQCEDNLSYAESIKSGDESQCENLADEALRNQCYDKIYMNLAVDDQDMASCEKITDANLKSMCLDQVQMILSRYAQTVDDCAVITSDSLRKQCEDNFYLQSSKTDLSVENCDNISDANLSDQCKQTVTQNIEVVQQSQQAAQTATVTKTFQEILDLCDNLSGNRSVSCKDAVYPQMAFDRKDLSYCDKISDELVAVQCRKDQGDKINAYYLRQSLASKDKSLCELITDSELKSLCQSS